MKTEGRCYCGALHYELEGEPLAKMECHCRECQYISGGGPNFTMAMPEAGFRYSSGEPSSFTRSDLETPVTREFCGTCGTHMLTRSPRLPGVVLLKVGTLKDPALFEKPQAAIFTCDMQPFHTIAEGVPAFEKRPPPR